MLQDILSFTEYWRNARRRTLRVLDALPPSDLEWTYAPNRFTFGDLFRHLGGIERFMYAENVMHRPSTYPGHSASLAQGLDAVRAYVGRCHTEALEIFAGLSDADLQSKCHTPAGTPIAIWKWLRAMVEHEAHHRGQLYLMASMRGLRMVPLFGLTEEEVVARSSSPPPP
ncbi:MAG: DinB family protein [Acidobacteriia bacterium]|nr:DinB family protein [Terriglobia bacterium]